MYTHIFIGLGSNVGDREGHLKWAASQLDEHPAVEVHQVSSVYESESHTWGSEEKQDPYLNAVVQLKAERDPEEVLDICLTLEQKRGRKRTDGVWWEPRTLDLDILAFDDLMLSIETLRIPHPRIHLRKFVLMPWAEIAPDFEIPQPYNTSVAALLKECGDLNAIHKTTHQLLD